VHIRIPFALVSWLAATTPPLMLYISSSSFGKQTQAADSGKTSL